jgi:hypothetical protein
VNYPETPPSLLDRGWIRLLIAAWLILILAAYLRFQLHRVLEMYSAIR